MATGYRTRRLQAAASANGLLAETGVDQTRQIDVFELCERLGLWLAFFPLDGLLVVTRVSGVAVGVGVVGGEVVDDAVHFEVRGHLGLQVGQERDEVLRAGRVGGRGGDFARGALERAEQCLGAVAAVLELLLGGTPDGTRRARGERREGRVDAARGPRRESAAAKRPRGCDPGPPPRRSPATTPLLRNVIPQDIPTQARRRADHRRRRPLRGHQHDLRPLPITPRRPRRANPRLQHRPIRIRHIHNHRHRHTPTTTQPEN